MSRKRVLLVIGAVAGAGVIALSAVGSVSNCGGNSAALANVRTIALIARVALMESPDHPFCFTEASGEDRDALASESHNHWVRTARFLVSTRPIFEHRTKEHDLIAVCDTPYRNVPQQWITAPPTHAAGYSDGSCGLISTSEFAALDLSTFRPLDELYPEKH